MIVRDRTNTIDDVWRLSQLPENEHKFFYLIDGELFFMSRPGRVHGKIAALTTHYLLTFVLARDSGEVIVESGFHPPGNQTILLGPDVAFVSREKLPEPSSTAHFFPVMPDIAVDVLSPSNSLPELRRKADIYLRQGTTLVWLVNPADKTFEVWRLADDKLTSETVGPAGALSGETVLPGFSLALKDLFALA